MHQVHLPDPTAPFTYCGLRLTPKRRIVTDVSACTCKECVRVMDDLATYEKQESALAGVLPKCPTPACNSVLAGALDQLFYDPDDMGQRTCPECGRVSDPVKDALSDSEKDRLRAVIREKIEKKEIADFLGILDREGELEDDDDE